jgi:hypothetical protein
MKYSFLFGRRAVPLALAAAITLLAPLARPAAGLAQDETAPGGVARISDMNGSVAIQRGDANTAVDAVINAPVLPADYVNTGADSRAEVEFDPGTMVRLGGNVQMRLSKIEPNDREIQLAEGTIDVRLLHGSDGQTIVDTPSVSIVPRESGSYRITVTHDGETQITVRSGHADVETPSGAQPIGPGVTVVAQGPANEPNIQSVAEVATDDFDAFNDNRDRVYTQVAAVAPYVNPNVPGVEDLPSYGHWESDQQYGNVWVPNNVGPDWAPYQDGSWAWEDYYGWTWVAAEPWGWAPYHYGRWYHSPRWGWAWTPPALGYAVPAWSPALVGFVGFGATIGAVSIGIGFGFGNIGWVPLAPYEAFHPWWGPHATVVSVAAFDGGIGRVYRNAGFNYGVTSISTQRWLAGDFRHRVPMTVAALRDQHFGAVRGGLPVVPSAANLRFSSRPGSAQVAFHPMDRSFAGHASIPQRTPFAARQQALARSYHAEAPAAHFAPTNSARRGGSAVNGERIGPTRGSDFAPRGGNDPWSHFNGNRGTTFGGFRGANEARPQVEGRPSFSRGESRSESQARPSFARPSSGNTFARPQGAERPSYARPSNENFSRPSQNFSRPSNENFSRPSQSFSRPSNENFSRPSQNFSRPSYGGGGGYARPQAAPQAPARSEARPPAAEERSASAGHGGENRDRGNR